jgi:hypothetical protein
MAPGGVPVNRENRPPPERANMHFGRKAGAKVLLFFELTKYFRVFFAKTCIFRQKSVILHRFIVREGPTDSKLWN